MTTVLTFEPLADRRFRSENRYFVGRKTFLASVEISGERHAAYPDALRTLCGLLTPPDRGRPGPTCPTCVEVSILFDEIDCSVPDHWRPDYVPLEERQETRAA